MAHIRSYCSVNLENYNHFEETLQPILIRRSFEGEGLLQTYSGNHLTKERCSNMHEKFDKLSQANQSTIISPHFSMGFDFKYQKTLTTV